MLDKYIKQFNIQIFYISSRDAYGEAKVVDFYGPNVTSGTHSQRKESL